MLTVCSVQLMTLLWFIAKFHYTDPTRPDRTRPHKVRGLCLVLAKFHYTGPARSRTTRISEKLRWSVRVSDKVRAGPRGSGRACVVEFSLECIRSTSHGPVSVSVCPQVGVLLKRLNTGSHKQHHMIAQGL